MKSDAAGRREGEGAPPDPGPRAEAVAAALASAYLPVQYAFVQFFSEHLVDCAKAVDHDLAAVLVLAVLGQRRLEARLQGHGIEGEDLPRSCISASRIADVTGIPRETVRRKLVAMRDKGWIDVDPVHGWFVSGAPDNTAVSAAMRETEKRFFRRLARLHVRLSQILEQA